jgi:hypothetical protein
MKRKPQPTVCLANVQVVDLLAELKRRLPGALLVVMEFRTDSFKGKILKG